MCSTRLMPLLLLCLLLLVHCGAQPIFVCGFKARVRRDNRASLQSFIDLVLSIIDNVQVKYYKSKVNSA